MYTTQDSEDSAGPPEEVFKLIYDPSRTQEWLAGTVGIEDIGPPEPVGDGAADEQRRYTIYRQFAPETPMVQVMRSFGERTAIVVRCTVTGIRMEWRLEELPGAGTRIGCVVEAPEENEEVIAQIPAMTRASLEALARLAEREV